MLIITWNQTCRRTVKKSKIALICNKTCIPGYTARSQRNYDKFPPRAFGKTNPVKRSFQDSWFINRTSLHYDEANDLTFCMVAYKDVKLNSNYLDKALISSMDFRTRRMLVLPSRNTIPQSAIGIDNNDQSDYLTCIQRKNRRSRLEGSK